jgi:signal transduction histidine kinase
VNDVAVESPVTLQVGDRVRFGTTTFVFTRHDELEERLRQLEKLDAMGALVKGLAHDFNNMLMVLQGGLEILSERVPIEDPDVQRMLDDMDKAATSASALVRRLLRIGRSKPGTLELVKMPALIGDAVTMARNLKLDHVRISAQIVPDAMVRGSYEELKQVFLNLILNARDAMPKGGDITIKGAITTLDRSSALSLHLENAGKYIEIMVTDTGSGMDQATLARIFEPFFTTKAATKGSGLGLAMVYSSLRNHKGAIYAESMVGRGTTFRLLLPAVA